MPAKQDRKMDNFLLKKLVMFLCIASLSIASLQVMASDTRDQSIGHGLHLRPKSPWRELYFQGGKGFTRIAASVRLRSPLGFCPSNLSKPLSGFAPCPLEGPDIRVLSVESAVSTLIPPQEEYIQHVWFNRKTMNTYQRIRWKKGSRPWIKTYTWGKTGVQRLKLQPSGPMELPFSPDKWTKKHKSFFTYPRGGRTGCGIISEPTILLYLASVMDPKRTSFPFELCVFVKKQLHKVTMRLVRLKPMKVSFESYGLQGQHRVEKTVKPLVFFITSSPVDPEDKKHEAFSLLGLQEEIYIFIDPETGLPVRIIGKTKRIGDMVLALTGAWLR